MTWSLVRDGTGVYLTMGINAINALRTAEQALPDSVVIMTTPLTGESALGMIGDETPIAVLEDLYLSSSWVEARTYPFWEDYEAATLEASSGILTDETTFIAVDYAGETVLYNIRAPDFAAVETTVQAILGAVIYTVIE